MSDSVEKPSHYNQGSVETIDGIRAALGESFADYCRGNVLKYVWRCGKKGDAIEDLRKARKYLEWAIETMEANPPETPDSSDPKPLAIPEGWRELTADDLIVFGDLYDDGDRWLGYTYDPASHRQTKYDKRIHVRHIRKIEHANCPETPNSSTWVPKVGDKVRVVGGIRVRVGVVGFINEIADLVDTFAAEIKDGKGTLGWFNTSDLELLEAAK